MTEHKYAVYMHIFPNKKRYIGITGQKPKERWRINGNGYKPQKLVRRAIEKYGWENIEHVIIAEGLSAIEAGALEKKLISKYQTTDPSFGYNQSIGGENSPIGVKRSEETKRKLSMAHIGIVPGNKGRKLSDTQKAHLSRINLGKKLSNETRLKISQSNKGHKPTELAMKRVKEVCNKPCICLSTGVKYESATIAAKETGEHRNTITRHCRGEVLKPRWEYTK